MDTFAEIRKLYEMLKASEGNDGIVIYCAAEKAMRRLPPNRNIHVDSVLLAKLNQYTAGESTPRRKVPKSTNTPKEKVIVS